MKVLASKPASRRKYPGLGSRTALFFDLLKMGQGHDQFCFVLKNAGKLAKKILKTFFSMENACIFRKNFGAKAFFFEDHFCVVFLALTSSIPVLGLKRVCPGEGCHWPRIFWCPWPWRRALCPRLHLWLVCLLQYENYPTNFHFLGVKHPVSSSSLQLQKSLYIF